MCNVVRQLQLTHSQVCHFARHITDHRRHGIIYATSALTIFLGGIYRATARFVSDAFSDGGLPRRWTQTLEQYVGFTAPVRHDSRPVQETSEDSFV